jgi:RNA polymerase sigma-70 factor (ECF subfamily)
MPIDLEVPTRASLLRAAADPANRKAREAFAEYYGGVIRAWCRRNGLQETDADDVAQALVLRLLKGLPSFEYDPGKGRYRAYVRQAVDWAIKDFHRRHQRDKDFHRRHQRDPGVLGQLHEVPAPDDPAVEDLTRELSGHMERDRQVQEARDRVRQRLGEATWQAFWLTTVEDLPTDEVARRLGKKPGAVRVAKCRTLRAIREELGLTNG